MLSTGIGKTPFLRLLLPLLAAIVFSSIIPEYLNITKLVTGITGLSFLIISIFIDKEYKFKFRWLFGVGIFLFLFSLTQVQYQIQEQNALFSFSEYKNCYIGTITDIPEIKPRTIAVNVKTGYPDKKKAVLYIQQSKEALNLEAGDEILFFAEMQPFKNYGNPDNFDYSRYMKIKGYSASAYVATTDWSKTGRKPAALAAVSQRLRSKALDFYKKLELDNDAGALISALTLGYKKELTEDLQEAFRVTGTAHVLAVSGLHVGIIFIVINLAFSFLGKHGNPFIIRQFMVIIALWAYVFVAGMSASVVRAAIMLTINCVANMVNRRGFTYNTLAAAAFFILIYSPFSLYDISFQMSFAAVFAILFFQPKLKEIYTPRHKITKYIYNLLIISFSAQLGVFPLVLYYFSTFPTYFFITNLLVVPLIGIIIYSIVPVILFNILTSMDVWIIEFFNSAFQWVFGAVVELTLQTVYIAEKLPFAQISDVHISLVQLILLLIFIIIFGFWIFSRLSKPLIASLVVFLILMLTVTYDLLSEQSLQLVVFNRNNKSEIDVYYENKRCFIHIPENGIIPITNRSVVRLSDNTILNYFSDNKFRLDVLILSGDSFSTDQLLQLFNPEIIVLDSSVPAYYSNRMREECNSLGVRFHDVRENGAFSLKF